MDFNIHESITNGCGNHTHWEKLLGSDWLRHREFILNLMANFVIPAKLQISSAKID